MGNTSSNSDSDEYNSDAASDDGDAGGNADSDHSEDNLVSNLALLFKHSALRELAAKIRVDVPGKNAKLSQYKVRTRTYSATPL